MIVSDTNLIAYLLIEGEQTSHAKRVFIQDPEWIAPVLWRSEFRNLLSLYVRKKLMNLRTSLEFMKDAELLLQNREYEVESSQVLRLAKVSGCSAYDCEFVALAQEFGVPLVTSDSKLLSVFPSVAKALKDI